MQLCRGVSAEEADQYRLPADPMHEFNYLNQSGCSSIEGVDDASDFAALKAAMLAVGISKQQQTEVYCLPPWLQCLLSGDEPTACSSLALSRDYSKQQFAVKDAKHLHMHQQAPH